MASTVHCWSVWYDDIPVICNILFWIMAKYCFHDSKSRMPSDLKQLECLKCPPFSAKLLWFDVAQLDRVVPHGKDKPGMKPRWQIRVLIFSGWHFFVRSTTLLFILANAFCVFCHLFNSTAFNHGDKDVTDELEIFTRDVDVEINPLLLTYWLPVLQHASTVSSYSTVRQLERCCCVVFKSKSIPPECL